MGDLITDSCRDGAVMPDHAPCRQPSAPPLYFGGTKQLIGFGSSGDI